MSYGDNIDRIHSFSLGDFHDFDNCVFRFFVNHHLGKKYELAEGNPIQTLGSLLDLAIKKLHQTKAYFQPPEYLQNLVKAAEVSMREDINFRGKNSFYGAQLEFLTPEVVEKAKEVFKTYCQKMKGKFKKLVITEISQKPKPFWERQIMGSQPLKIWGSPDALEMGEDQVPEIVDYKYFGDTEKGKSNLDMDLMPKVYTLLCASDLKKAGYFKARFKVRIWNEPENESFYEEFDLNKDLNLENFFRDKIERILRTDQLSFCEKDFCRVCKSPEREKWIKELQVKGWIKS
ncbi:MAG: PD-(D/E)XK nuclease family protein [Candidatus Daviesbacteria bacterium]